MCDAFAVYILLDNSSENEHGERMRFFFLSCVYLLREITGINKCRAATFSCLKRTFSDSIFFNIKTCCFYFSFMIVNEELWGSGLLVGQIETWEYQYIFITFLPFYGLKWLLVKIINRLIMKIIICSSLHKWKNPQNKTVIYTPRTSIKLQKCKVFHPTSNLISPHSQYIFSPQPHRARYASVKLLWTS